MSVYTIVSESEIQRFLEHYTIGELVSYEGVGEGIENTNYFVDTSNGKYVLTLFEQMSTQEIPQFLNLMAFYAEHQLPVPHPIADKQDDYLRILNQKPATLITRLTGSTIQTPSPAICRSLGLALGKMHMLSNQIKQWQQKNPRDFSWCLAVGEKVLPLLSPDEANLLQSELKQQKQTSPEILPQGIIHADLFRDNALFNSDQLTGLIDFYYACNGAFLYDLAIIVNDWCIEDNQTIHTERYRALLAAYKSIRPFQEQEIDNWQNVLRCAALRFWLSRLQDKLFPRPGAITHIKDPDVFKNILLQHKAKEISLC